MRRTFLLISILSLTAGCATTHQVQTLDTQLTQKGAIGNEIIGITPQNEAVIQEKQSLEDKLRKQRWANAEDEQKLRSDHEQLTRCQGDLANPLLDGNGELPEIPEVDVAMDLSKQKTALGLDESGNLVFVTKELVQDRINREQRYSDNLKSNSAIVTKHLKKCLFKMGIARQKKDLAPSWYYRDESKGYEYETDLSVGFANAKRKPASAE